MSSTALASAPILLNHANCWLTRCLDRFFNVTNGSEYSWISLVLALSHQSQVTPRRWLDQCNPGLSNLIQETLRVPKGDFLKDLYKLEVRVRKVLIRN